MKIYFSKYTLNPFNDKPPRQGALLKVCFKDDLIGYADCHPWPELGDYPIKEQITLLSRRECTLLTHRSMEFARLDAEARKEGKNLFADLKIPPSHWLTSSFDEEVPDTFDRVKIKLGSDTPDIFTEYLSSLPAHILLRLDFNGSATDRVMKLLEPWKDRIEFIEDPLPYDSDHWTRFQTTYGIKLACDQASEKHLDSSSYQYTVIKPAMQDPVHFYHDDRPIVVTSYLDHPLGQMAAAYTAGVLQQFFPERIQSCGLLSHLYYQPNCYSACITNQGPQLIPSLEGTGFGFDQQLDQENWQELS